MSAGLFPHGRMTGELEMLYSVLSSKYLHHY